MADKTRTLSVGDTAPDFELSSHDKHTVTLHQYRGKKHVVLVFYPLAWTPV